jgi:hypothetical protein
VTRPAKIQRGQTLADAFATDAMAAILWVLQQAETALTAGQIKGALEAGGVPKTAADSEWPKVQKRIKSQGNVVVDARTYRWTSDARATYPVNASESPVEAFELIVKGRLHAPKRAALVAIVRAALLKHSQPSPGSHAPAPDDPEEAARRRQRDVDAIRLLAELATEVEELTVNEAEADVMIHRVRSRVNRSGLEPIDRAGAETTFDRKRHKPISGSISDGATVVVVRPGYIWKAPAEDVLIGKAVVVE